MPKPEAFSIHNNTNMTCNTSPRPLPVSHIKQAENMWVDQKRYLHHPVVFPSLSQ